MDQICPAGPGNRPSFVESERTRTVRTVQIVKDALLQAAVPFLSLWERVNI
jgi:hypothetical protein